MLVGRMRVSVYAYEGVCVCMAYSMHRIVYDVQCTLST